MKISSKNAQALRFALVLVGLLGAHVVLAAIPSGTLDLPQAALWLCAILLCFWVLVVGMFFRWRELDRGPLLAAVLGCAVTLYLLKQERDVMPNLLLVVAVTAVAIVPPLARAIVASYFSKSRH